MTREQLDAIRARVAFAHAEFNSPHDSVCGDLYVQDTTRLLAEVERQMHYGVAQHEAAQDAIRGRIGAFKRGAEAMREAAAKWFMAGMFRMGGGESIADIIRHVPIPEDK